MITFDKYSYIFSFLLQHPGSMEDLSRGVEQRASDLLGVGDDGVEDYDRSHLQRFYI